jgi:hypothetical protein
MESEYSSEAIAGFSSRWWYGVAAVPLLVGVSYALIFVIKGTMGAMESNDVALLTNVSSAFTLLLVFVLNLGLVLAFAVSLVMDFRVIRNSEIEWTPSWGARESRSYTY